MIELGSLSPEQYAELVGNEDDPWDAVGIELEWRPKDRHVALRDSDGRLRATAGLVVVDVQFAERQPIPVAGIGGVIVAAPYRGEGLGRGVVAEVLRRAEGLGPDIGMLFWRPDRAGLYRGFGFG